MELIEQQNGFKLKLKELEDELLYRLASSQAFAHPLPPDLPLVSPGIDPLVVQIPSREKASRTS